MVVETALCLNTVLCSFSRILREISPTQQHLPSISSSIVTRTKQPCKHDVITICANSASHPSLHGLRKKTARLRKTTTFQHLEKAPQTLIEVNILKNRMIKINCYSTFVIWIWFSNRVSEWPLKKAWKIVRLCCLYLFAKALVAFQGKKNVKCKIFVGNSTRLLHA